MYINLELQGGYGNFANAAIYISYVFPLNLTDRRRYTLGKRKGKTMYCINSKSAIKGKQ